jgi:hypothetical protein
VVLVGWSIRAPRLTAFNPLSNAQFMNRDLPHPLTTLTGAPQLRRAALLIPQLNFKAIVDGLGAVLFEYPFRWALS